MDATQTPTRTSEQAATESGQVLYKKHPLAIRWFHWINFPVLFVMIWSGLMIYWANTAFHVQVFGLNLSGLLNPKDPSAPLFPDSWFHPQAPNWVPNLFVTKVPDDPHRYLWSLDMRLAEGMGWHFLFAWFFAINGLLYVIFLAVSGQWRHLVPKWRAIGEAIQVVLVDLHLSKAKLPVRKYNAAQQIAYSGVILMGALMLLTGIAIYKPSQQSWLTHLLGGYTVARFIHFWTTMAFLGFFVVHVGQVVRTGWNNFRGMVTGHELVTGEEARVLRDEGRGNEGPRVMGS